MVYGQVYYDSTGTTAPLSNKRAPALHINRAHTGPKPRANFLGRRPTRDNACIIIIIGAMAAAAQQRSARAARRAQIDLTS
jgi:hypothetical protein